MSEELIAISKFFKTAKLALVSNYMFYVDHPPHTPAPFLTAYLSIMKLPSRPTYQPTYLPTYHHRHAPRPAAQNPLP